MIIVAADTRVGEKDRSPWRCRHRYQNEVAPVATRFEAQGTKHVSTRLLRLEDPLLFHDRRRRLWRLQQQLWQK